MTWSNNYCFDCKKTSMEKVHNNKYGFYWECQRCGRWYNPSTKKQGFSKKEKFNKNK